MVTFSALEDFETHTNPHSTDILYCVSGAGGVASANKKIPFGDIAQTLNIANLSGSIGYDDLSGNAATNFGIGTDNPLSPLQVDSSSSTFGENIRLMNLDNTAGAGPSILFHADETTTQSMAKGGIAYARSTTWGRGDMHFLQNKTANFSDADISESVMTITNGGNVGIRTTAPTSPLHVVGADASALPVLTLEQLDISEEMIQFETTIGTGNAIEAVGAKTLTTTHFIKVTLPGGLTRYIPAGTIA